VSWLLESLLVCRVTDCFLFPDSPLQHTCRDPVVQKEYANDPLCKQVGTFRGVGDMLLGVSALLPPWPLLSLARSVFLSIQSRGGVCDKNRGVASLARLS
jgi:hypothetical protein